MADPIGYDAVGRRAQGAQRYITGSETLRVTVFNAANGVRVRVSGRRLDCNGNVSEFSDQFTPATNRTASVLDKTPGDGWLLSVSVRIDAGSPTEGQAYARIEIGVGTGAQFVGLDVLTADSITAGHPLGWPGSPIRGPLDGAGAVRTIIGTTPGAGVDLSETVPTGVRWELLAINAQLVTAVAAANRRVRLILSDGSRQFFRADANQSQAASLTWTYSFGQGVTQIANTTDGAIQTPLPVGVRLAAGYQFFTVTLALQAADQWQNLSYIVREWIEGA